MFGCFPFLILYGLVFFAPILGTISMIQFAAYQKQCSAPDEFHSPPSGAWYLLGIASWVPLIWIIICIIWRP
jgi:hypothetical protein